MSGETFMVITVNMQHALDWAGCATYVTHEISAQFQP